MNIYQAYISVVYLLLLQAFLKNRVVQMQFMNDGKCEIFVCLGKYSQISINKNSIFICNNHGLEWQFLHSFSVTIIKHIHLTQLKGNS